MYKNNNKQQKEFFGIRLQANILSFGMERNTKQDFIEILIT